MKLLVNVAILPTEKATENGIVRSTHQPKDYKIANRSLHGNKIFDAGFEHSTQEWLPFSIYFTSKKNVEENFRGLVIITVRDSPYIQYLEDVSVTEKTHIYTKSGNKFSFKFYDVNPLIATNDPNLRTQSQFLLYSIPSSFNEAFVKAGGKIKEALIETWGDSDKVKSRADGSVIVSPAKTFNTNDLPVEAIMNVIRYCEDKQIYDKLGMYGDFYYKLKNWSNKYQQ